MWRVGWTGVALQVVMGIASGVLAYNTLSVSGTTAAVAFGTYLVALVLYYILVLRLRRAQDHLQAEVLWDLFNNMNQKIFADSYRTRFTLFREDPVRHGELVPWTRFQKGGSGPLREAARSRARYRRGEGSAGRAWNEAGESILLTQAGPFETREAMVQEYINSLHIRPDVAEKISEYMEQAYAFFSYGFVDSRNHLLGVLSVDLCGRVTQHENGDLTFEARRPDREAIVINMEEMMSKIGSIQSVLESLFMLERRR